MWLVIQVVIAKPECKAEDGKGCGCAESPQEHQPASTHLPGKILYGSQKGTAATFAKQLAMQAATFGVELQAMDLKEYEVEQLWREHLVLIVLSTYENGSPPDSARYGMYAAREPYYATQASSFCITVHMLCKYVVHSLAKLAEKV